MHAEIMDLDPLKVPFSTPFKCYWEPHEDILSLLDIYSESFLGSFSYFFNNLRDISPISALAITLRRESNSVLEDVTNGLYW